MNQRNPRVPCAVIVAAISLLLMTGFAPLTAWSADDPISVVLHDAVKDGSFDLYTHHNDPSKATLGENVGWITGMALLADGNVAALFPCEGHQGGLIYVLRVNTTQNPAFSKVAGPYFPAYSANTSATLGLGLTRISGGELGILGYWQQRMEVSATTTTLVHHHYLFRYSLGADQASLAGEIENKADASYDSIAWLPAEGGFPEQWAMDAHSNRVVQFANATGEINPAKDVTLGSIGLGALYRTAAGVCRMSTGDLLVAGCPTGPSGQNWSNSAIARMTRAGEPRCALRIGVTSPDEMPSGTRAFCELSDGRILVGGYLSTAFETQGDLYRYYVIRPLDPEAWTYGAPSESVSMSTVTPTCRVGETVTFKGLFRNPGSAALIVSNCRVEPAVTGRPNYFTVTGPTSFDVAPSNGTTVPPVETTITFSAQAMGEYASYFRFDSNAANHNESGFAIYGRAMPASWADDMLTSVGQLVAGAAGLGSVTMTADGNALLVIAHLDATHSRILRVPVVRDGSGSITGLDLGAVETVADVARSEIGLVQTSDGMLWYGKGTGSGVLVQRKPDGTTFEQTIPKLKDFDVVFQVETSGMKVSAGLQDVLVVTQNDDFCVWERTLTKNGDGFYEVGASSTKLLHKLGSVGKIWPADKWTRPGYLMRWGSDFNASLEICAGSDALWAGQNTQPPTTQIYMPTKNIGWVCRDPQTGHLLYTDSQTYIHRARGMEAYTDRAKAAANTGFLY